MDKAVFFPLPLCSFLTASAKAICVRGGILVHQTLTTPQAGISQEDCSSLNRFPSAFSRGLGPAPASPSIHPVTWTATLLSAPPLHTLMTRPFPAPSRARKGLLGTQEDRVPGLWRLKTHIPSAATSLHTQGGSQPTSRRPCTDGASFRGTSASSGTSSM